MEQVRTNVGELCLAVWRFEGMRLQWEHRFQQAQRMTLAVLGQELGNIHIFLANFEAATKDLNLRAVGDRLAKVRYRLNEPNATTIELLCADIRVLAETTIDELKRHVFVHLTAEKSHYYSNASQFYEESWNAYPSAQNDMASACRCYALGENTATVFHSMGVVQAGLYAMANHLKLAFPTGIELQQWGAVIDQIESEVDKQQKATARQQKDQSRDQVLEFYSNTGMQFRYFKDAWRNRVAHNRKSYDADEAHTILVHVKNFMVALAKQVRELP